ncbi:CFEM domain-containing, partial [Fusarium albosuccineum]
MKTLVTSLSLLALVQLATAQSACLTLSTLFPDCAFPCVTSAGSAVGCTVSTDLACRCDPASSSAIQARAAPCVIAACTRPGELQSALVAGPSICGCHRTAVPDPEPTTTTEEETTTTEETTAEETSTEETTTGETTAEETSSEPESTTSSDITITLEPGTTTTAAPTETGSCGSEFPCQASVDAVPKCAEGCLSSAAVTEAECAFDNYECQCSSTAVIQNAAQGCVINDCGIPDALKVLDAVGSLCKCVDENPTTPCENTATQTSDDNTATETSDDATTGEETSETTAPPETETETSSGDNPGEPTCTAGTTEDCAPVASSAIPECAQKCFTSAAPSIGCDVTDFACQCEQEAQESLSQLLVPCVITACPGESLTAVITGASSVCACATAVPSGDCTTTDDGTGHETTTKPTITKEPPTKTHGPTTTCEDAETADCGPVATSAVPECAQKCFTSAAPEVGCDVHDYTCQCEEEAQESLSQLLVPCVVTACPGASLPAVIAGASSVCACAHAAPTGGCSPGSTGKDTTTQPTKTGTGGHGGGGGGGGGGKPTCKPGTASDCGPVASSAVPSCAQACFTSAAPKVGCD